MPQSPNRRPRSKFVCPPRSPVDGLIARAISAACEIDKRRTSHPFFLPDRSISSSDFADGCVTQVTSDG
jgi:hypothetical protein